MRRFLKPYMTSLPAPDYYIATISLPTFYHNDLNGIVDWMAAEGVDLILFPHVGGWSGPSDGTSIYTFSEPQILDRAVDNGMAWISPAGDRAHATWSGFFKDDDNDGLHEFAPGVECDKVTLEETDHSYTAQIRWNDPWGAVVRDLEAVLVNEDTGDIEATSRKHQFFPNDPNELIDFTTPARRRHTACVWH